MYQTYLRLTILVMTATTYLVITACQSERATPTTQENPATLNRPLLQPQGPAFPNDGASFMLEEEPGTNGHPSLADFWDGEATFRVDIVDTGLPMGESETIQVRSGELWSYVHASDRSAGVVDQCGAPVEFPGCTVIYSSQDGGESFSLQNPVCQFECTRCPCTDDADHTRQQQYPRVAYDGERLHLVYEFGAMVMHRSSSDGLSWDPWAQIPWTGVWEPEHRECTGQAQTNEHPFVLDFYDCLVGGPPGAAVDGSILYVFLALGQNPGAMGCYFGHTDGEISALQTCRSNPLFVGNPDYGPLEEKGPATNPHFSFRTISSAEVVKIGDYFYMLFEGVRGPGPGDPGDTQFALGLARSQANQIDAPWDLYPDNPILVDLPGNIGLGHADLIVLGGKTYLYTSLDGIKRSRLVLEWPP